MAHSKHTSQQQIDEMRRELAGHRQNISGVKNSSRGYKTAVKLAEWIAFSSAVAVLLYAFISIQTAKSKGEIPSLLGFYLFTIESGSMEPTLDVGSIIVCRNADKPDSLEENDIVTFYSLSGDIVTHRIIEVVTHQSGAVSYRTKGDNPVNSPDLELLTPDRVIAVYAAKIPLT